MVLGGSITLFVGLVLAIPALFLMRRAIHQHRQLVATPTTPIARTPVGRLVEIQGTVVPSEQGVIVSPASGRQVVLYHVDVYDVGGSTSLIHTAKDRREFWVQDEHGDYARILADRSDMIADGTRYRMDQHQVDASDMHMRYAPMSAQMHAWAVGVTGAQDRPLMVEEQLIAAGDRLFAQGFGERTPDGTLFLRDRGDRKLFISTRSEPEVREVRTRERTFGCILAAIGAVISAIGVALIGAGWYFDL